MKTVIVMISLVTVSILVYKKQSGRDAGKRQQNKNSLVPADTTNGKNKAFPIYWNHPPIIRKDRC
jgi:hypothetical protein